MFSVAIVAYLSLHAVMLALILAPPAEHGSTEVSHTALDIGPGGPVYFNNVEYWPLPHYKQRFDPGWQRYFWECPSDPELSYTRQPHYDQRLDPGWSSTEWADSNKARDPGWHPAEPDGNI